jgi:hypothetical protein
LRSSPVLIMCWNSWLSAADGQRSWRAHRRWKP